MLIQNAFRFCHLRDLKMKNNGKAIFLALNQNNTRGRSLRTMAFYYRLAKGIHCIKLKVVIVTTCGGGRLC